MRLAFGLEYDGTDYSGWQRQSGTRTVQGCLEEALSQVADDKMTVVCAGRTDAGVHATGQVVHVDTHAVRDIKGWIRGTNSNLPGDIRIHWVAEMNEAFHARFSAQRRHYRYVIENRPTRSALLRNRACWEYSPLDEVKMAHASRQLLGEHDFTSFRATACQANSPVRTIYLLEVTRSGNFVYIDVVANAFLYHMVRCLAGVLMTIGRGEQPGEWVTELIEARDRTKASMNAAAAGLYLLKVEYPEQFNVPPPGWMPTCG